MSSNATTNETSNVTSLPSTPKAQTAKEVIAANVKLLIEQLEAGHSEGLTAYLCRIIPRYSAYLPHSPRLSFTATARFCSECRYSLLPPGRQ
jgi:hypothetical protein